MTINEAIQHCLEEAGELQKRADSAELIDILEGLDVEACKECAAEHRQLAEWLTELIDSRAVQNEQEIFIHELMSKLEEAKRLLKAAVEGYSFIGHITKDYACPSFTSCSACPMDEGKQCKIWEHEAEALKLIGGSGNGT